MFRAAVGATLILLSGPSLGRAAAPIQLQIYPTVSAAPATIEARITIEPEERNRAFELAIDGPVASATARELEGAAGRKRWTFTYRDLPAGEYTAVVVLSRVGGHVERSAAKSFLVSGVQ